MCKKESKSTAESERENIWWNLKHEVTDAFSSKTKKRIHSLAHYDDSTLTVRRDLKSELSKRLMYTNHWYVLKDPRIIFKDI